MSGIQAILIDRFVHLMGRPACPALIDVRTDEDFADDPRLVPGTSRRGHRDVACWAGKLAGRPAVAVCQRGLKLNHGVAGWLRQAGARAEALEGGTIAWAEAGLPMVPEAALPPRDEEGRTLWVTRAQRRSTASPVPG